VVDRFAGSSPREVRDGGTRQTCAPRAADIAARSLHLTHGRGIARSIWSRTTRTAHVDCVGNSSSLASLLVRQRFCSCKERACIRTFRRGSPGWATRVSRPLTKRGDRSTSTRLTQESACTRQVVVPLPPRVGPGQQGVQHRLSASRPLSTSSIRGRIETRACLVGRAPFLPAEVIAAPPASRRVAKFHTLASGWISPQS